MKTLKPFRLEREERQFHAQILNPDMTLQQGHECP